MIKRNTFSPAKTWLIGTGGSCHFSALHPNEFISVAVLLRPVNCIVPHSCQNHLNSFWFLALFSTDVENSAQTPIPSVSENTKYNMAVENCHKSFRLSDEIFVWLVCICQAQKWMSGNRLWRKWWKGSRKVFSLEQWASHLIDSEEMYISLLLLSFFLPLG